MAFIACTKIESREISKPKKSSPFKFLVKDLIEGIKYIFQSSTLITVLIVTIIMNALVFTYQSQLSVIVQNNL